MKDKICIVTGGSSGLGNGAAINAAKMGARVVLLSRDNKRGRRACEEIKARSGNPNINWIPADLSSRQSVCDFVDQFRSHYDRLDILFNCAGVQSLQREITVDGLERNFATNYLGHFLLTNLLYESLRASSNSRVITVSGAGHKKSITEGKNEGTIDFDNLQGEKYFHFPKASKQAVLAKILFTYELARRWQPSGIQACTICPGLTRTNLASELPWYIRSYMSIRFVLGGAMEPEKSTTNLIKLANCPNVNGKYFEGRKNSLKEVRSSEESYDPFVAARLWEVSEDLLGRKFLYTDSLK